MLPFDEHAFGAMVSELDDWRRELDSRGPLIRSWEGQLRRDLEAESVHASTSLEGVPVTVDEVRHILAGERPATVSPADVELVRGYRDAMAYVQRRSDDAALEWSPELVKAIHDKILAGRFDHGAGRYGRDRSVVNSATREVLFTPPPDDKVPEIMREFGQHMERWPGHPALRSAWAHVAVAAIHPFGDGNGRTARVVASLAMYEGGFKRPEFCSLEEWWGRHRVEYYDAFTCLGRVFREDVDVTPFIRAHVGAQLAQVRALDLRLRTSRQIWLGLQALCIDAGLPERVSIALYDAFNGRETTSAYYSGVADVSPEAARIDLRTLVATRLMRAQGQARARRYVAGPLLYEQLAGALRLELREPSSDAIVGALASRELSAVTRRLYAVDGSPGSESASVIHPVGGPTSTSTDH